MAEAVSFSLYVGISFATPDRGYNQAEYDRLISAYMAAGRAFAYGSMEI